ncbi:hypothetical protein BDR05DRAFT_994348 [Suillus weaverae]|nr:hypothetical protein BDR05DRAFT_994348 [Suillus weaverae]
MTLARQSHRPQIIALAHVIRLRIPTLFDCILQRFMTPLLQQNLLHIIEPSGETEYVANRPGKDGRTLRSRLLQMVLDKVFHGGLNQRQGYLIIFDELEADARLLNGLSSQLRLCCDIDSGPEFGLSRWMPRFTPARHSGPCMTLHNGQEDGGLVSVFEYDLTHPLNKSTIPLAHNSLRKLQRRDVPQLPERVSNARPVRSMKSRPSDGQLNRDFKFGGKPSSAPSTEKNEEPLTLSDIIPPFAVAKFLFVTSLAGDESAALNSKRIGRSAARASYVPGHYGRSSELSFAGFDSFTEVRRGFGFHDHRPNFYPLPRATLPSQRNKHESTFSIESISSCGQVISHGSTDPFDFGASPLPSLRERPSSDEFSFTMSSLNDAFSFIHKQPRRRRVGGDASSFYFRAPAHS